MKAKKNLILAVATLLELSYFIFVPGNIPLPIIITALIFLPIATIFQIWIIIKVNSINQK